LIGSNSDYGLAALGNVKPEPLKRFLIGIAGGSLQFHSHVGHAYSPDSLLTDHADDLRGLWSAVGTFNEGANLLRRPGDRKYHSESVGKHSKAKASELGTPT
jgi:hypothetical protein